MQRVDEGLLGGNRAGRWRQLVGQIKAVSLPEIFVGQWVSLGLFLFSGKTESIYSCCMILLRQISAETRHVT